PIRNSALIINRCWSSSRFGNVTGIQPNEQGDSMRRLLISIIAVCTMATAADRYPDPDWPRASNSKETGISAEKIDAYAAWLREHAGLLWVSVVIKNAYLVYEGRGPRCHLRQKNDCGSILKPLQGTALGAALYQGKLKSLDVNALSYWKNPFITPFE